MTPAAAAVVTGGGAGIGAATARALAASGHRVVVVDRDEGAARAVADAVDGIAVAADVSREECWAEVARLVRDAATPLRALHLNAGANSGPQHQPIEALTDGGLERAIAVNVLGMVLGVRSLAPHLDTGASILVTASMAAVRPFPSDPVYAAAKHAQVGFVRSIAPVLAERGVRINVLCPGATDTGMVSADDRAWLSGAGVRLLAPEVVAVAAVDLLARDVTGEVFACIDDGPVRCVTPAGRSVP